MFDSPLLRKYLAYNLRILSSDRPVQAGAFPDCARARLMADHPECQLELAAFPCVAIVGESHFLLFMIEKDHMWYYDTV
jgi:hypothetical protein